MGAANCAASAYIASGRVEEGEEAQWTQRSIREAILIAQATDNAVISDEEIDTLEGQGLGPISVGRMRTTFGVIKVVGE